MKITLWHTRIFTTK